MGDVGREAAFKDTPTKASRNVGKLIPAGKKLLPNGASIHTFRSPRRAEAGGVLSCRIVVPRPRPLGFVRNGSGQLTNGYISIGLVTYFCYGNGLLSGTLSFSFGIWRVPVGGVGMPVWTGPDKEVTVVVTAWSLGWKPGVLHPCTLGGSTSYWWFGRVTAFLDTTAGTASTTKGAAKLKGGAGGYNLSGCS